jgi:hypothetical protein
MFYSCRKLRRFIILITMSIASYSEKSVRLLEFTFATTVRASMLNESDRSLLFSESLKVPLFFISGSVFKADSSVSAITLT